MRRLDPGQFRFDLVESSAAVATVRLVGELDLYTAPVLHSALVDLFDSGVRSVTIDLSDLDFIDSTGLSELVVALKRHRQAGGDLVLRSPNPTTAKVLEISGLDRIFTVAREAA